MFGYCATGGVPLMGGPIWSLGIKVSWVTLQEKAGRPMGPSTLRCEYLWEVVVVYVAGCCFGSAVSCLFFVKPLLFLRGRCLFSVVWALHDLTRVCSLIACPLRSFLCLELSSTPWALSLSLSFSLSLSLSLALAGGRLGFLYGKVYSFCLKNPAAKSSLSLSLVNFEFFSS